MNGPLGKARDVIRRCYVGCMWHMCVGEINEREYWILESLSELRSKWGRQVDRKCLCFHAKLLVSLTYPPTQSFVPSVGEGNLNRSSTRVNVVCHTHLWSGFYILVRPPLPVPSAKAGLWGSAWFQWSDGVYWATILSQGSKLYTPSTPNNSNETHTFMCLGRTSRFGQR